MISICIPIYNFNVTILVEELLKQTKKVDVEAEVILIDDASKLEFRKVNSKFKKKCTYIQLEKNIGRSRIRNLFLTYVNHSYLLFLDCDGIINDSNFLNNYLEAINKNPEAVICGGRVYPKNLTSKDEKLAWVYGTKRESKPASIRKISPQKYFMTNNFVIPRRVFETIKFDENITKYGYEDTIFGFELKKFNIPIIHVENTVFNGHLEKNAEFLRKEKEGIENLINILKTTSNKEELINEIKLLSTFKVLKPLNFIFKISFFLFKNTIQYLFNKSIINIYLLDFYRLGYLANQLKKSNISIE